jgi:hypothetical protein
VSGKVSNGTVQKERGATPEKQLSNAKETLVLSLNTLIVYGNPMNSPSHILIPSVQRHAASLTRVDISALAGDFSNSARMSLKLFRSWTLTYRKNNSTTARLMNLRRKTQASKPPSARALYRLQNLFVAAYPQLKSSSHRLAIR